MLWRFYMNITDWIGVTGYWSEIISIISHKNNIVFVKLFEMSFGSNILASFTEFQCQCTDTFGLIRVQTFEIHIQGNFLYKQCIPLQKVDDLWLVKQIVAIRFIKWVFCSCHSCS